MAASDGGREAGAGREVRRLWRRPLIRLKLPAVNHGLGL